MKLGIWTNPSNGSTRVYFNGVHTAEVEGIKVFAVQDDGRFAVRFSRSTYNSVQDQILDTIDRALEEMAGERVTKFAQLLNLATRV